MKSLFADFLCGLFLYAMFGFGLYGIYVAAQKIQAEIAYIYVNENKENEEFIPLFHPRPAEPYLKEEDVRGLNMDIGLYNQFFEKNLQIIQQRMEINELRERLRAAGLEGSK